MTNEFPYDVFLSHSAKDKAVVRPLAERLRQDGLKVWFDEWVLKPGDCIPAKIEEGLEHSRVLVFCMSTNAFGSDWARLEAGTFRFRDPLNQERRFIPLRLDNTPIKISLAHFLYIDWHPANHKQEYPKLLEACRSPSAERESDHVAPPAPTKLRREYNPFQTAGALNYNNPNYIRRRSDAEFEYLLEKPGRLICITGDFCVGKSSLMQQARRILPDHDFFGGGLADMRSEDATRFMKNFFKLFPSIGDWDELVEHSKQTPSVLLLDDLSEVLEPGFKALFPALVLRFSEPEAALRVIATSPERLQNLLAERNLNTKHAKPWEYVLVTAFHDAEARQLIELLPARPRGLAAKAFKEVKEHSGLRPQPLQCLCHRLYDAECDGASDAKLAALIQDPASYE